MKQGFRGEYKKKKKKITENGKGEKAKITNRVREMGV